MDKYNHIFFDLDRTLWDFESNSHDALFDIVNKYRLINIVNNFESFISIYQKHNVKMWEDYREKRIEKSILRWKRFYLPLLEFGIDDIELAKKIGEDYVVISPQKKKLFPFVHEVLQYLHKNYQMHIITNGFEEVQHIKLKRSELDGYFKNIVTSEMVGVQKPAKEIFAYALEMSGANKSESIMIGDDIDTDIAGAKYYGIDQIFFNPDNLSSKDIKPTFTISSLIELKEIL